MGRDENVIVFKDTENLCKTNPRISEAVKRSTSAQKLILEGDKLEDQKKGLYEDVANVIVTKNRWLKGVESFPYIVTKNTRI